MVHPELLAPAGDRDKLVVALDYGADAVYAGGPVFGLRAHAGSFGLGDLIWARDLTRARGRRLYLTLNAYLLPHEYPQLRDTLEELRPLDLDAYIVSDPGVIAEVRRIDPKRPLHLSTQANCTSPAAARFWQGQGIGRVNLARELSLADLRAFGDLTGLETEVFVHGAMCVAYSGRCLLSAAMTGRSANRGDCSHTCRWQYRVQEQTRPDQWFPAEEDARGSYLFNSRDLCLVEHLGAVLDAGAGALKIEGRMKSLYYVAAVTRVYRAALDAWLADPQGWRADPLWRQELEQVSHRPYDTGFLFPRTDAVIHDADAHYLRQADFLGVVRADASGGLFVDVRGRFFDQEALQLIGPAMRQLELRIDGLCSLEGVAQAVAQPNQQVRLSLPAAARPGDLLRRLQTPAQADQS